MHAAPPTLTLEDFDYDLPPELIAQHPLPGRSSSRLLRLTGDAISDHAFADLPEFFAAGENVPVAWPGGGRAHVTGNSFATPYVAGLCALFRSRYPRLTPFQVKTLLYLSAANVNVSPGGVPCQL